MRFFWCLLLLALLAVPASAITLDGSTAGDGYGLAALQTVETGFGDNQSELNAAWAKFEGGVLNLVFTGNLHDFNKLSVFFDTTAGGQNTIGPDTNNGGVNPPNDNWASELSGIGPNTSGNPGPGFTFDAGFAADYFFIARRDGGNTQFDVDYAVIGGGASAFQGAGDIFGATAEGSAPNVLPTYGISVGANNSNAAGVLGGSGPANAAAAIAVQTGVEVSIPLSSLGSPAVGSSIRISAFINGSNHDYLSNQILSGFVAPQGNPGGDSVGGFTNDLSRIDLNTFAGAQYFELRVVPEPSTIALIGLMLAGIGCWRRK